MKTIDIALSALFIALIVMATTFVHIPTGVQGYIHIGDSMIFLAIMMMPSYRGVVVGGLGSALADIYSGYVSFAPLTFIVKLLMGLVFFMIVSKNRQSFKLRILAFVAASVIMIAGYFFGEAVMFGSIASGIPEIPMNAIQAVGSAIVFEVVYKVLVRTGTIGKIAGE